MESFEADRTTLRLCDEGQCAEDLSSVPCGSGDEILHEIALLLIEADVRRQVERRCEDAAKPFGVGVGARVPIGAPLFDQSALVGPSFRHPGLEAVVSVHHPSLVFAIVGVRDCS